MKHFTTLTMMFDKCILINLSVPGLVFRDLECRYNSNMKTLSKNMTSALSYVASLNVECI